MLAKINLPKVWLAGFIGLAWLIAQFWSPLGPAFAWFGWALIAVGIALILWAAIHFRRAATTIIPGKAPSALVSGGPYRYSRNPIYLADVLILAGVALIVGSPLALLLVVPFQQVILRLFILPEEAILERDLGRAYTDFKVRVPRWI